MSLINTLRTKNIGVNGFKRYLTLQTDRIYTLPIVILMPHSSCNCRCVMCDIWKGNGQSSQLTEDDIRDLLTTLKRLETRWVIMSGGEALMNPRLFEMCQLLRDHGLKVTLLSTGLLLKGYAAQVVAHSDEVIVSLDGTEAVHNAIRRIPKAYRKLAEGIVAVKAIQPAFALSARCVIQQANFADWPNIITAAQELGLDSISFLPADVSSEAFNRPDPTQSDTQAVALTAEQLPTLREIIERIITEQADLLASGFIVESADKLRRIHQYYAALLGQANFPRVQCNAPWVSAVVEADGTVRPCFFHAALGNIHQDSLTDLINQPDAISFRKSLDLDSDPLCRQCVCSLNLRPWVKIG